MSEKILRRVMTATMTLDEHELCQLISMVKSVRWATIYLNKPMAADWNDVYFREIVLNYYRADRELFGEVIE